MDVILGSSLVATVVTLLVNVIVQIVANKREDARFEREDAIRREALEEARKNRASEVALEERREAIRRHAEEDRHRQEAIQSQAKDVLSALNKVEVNLATQGPVGSFEAYRVDPELRRKVREASRLIPDADLREFVSIGMQVISELWVPASMGEGPEEVGQYQIQILTRIIATVARVATNDGWDRSLIIELDAAKEAIDVCWEDSRGPHPA
jgi:hypothetical protein